MKKVTLLLMAAVFAVSCSDDDSAARSTPQLCDCEKVILEYDQTQQVYNIVDVQPFGTDCSTDTGGARATVDGVTYRIECTPQSSND